MTKEEERKLKDWAYGIANCAIHDFRIDILKPGSYTYDEIKAKIDWYIKVTYHE
jgi:hypothetical protein